jgi:hypothetical protein
MTARTTPRLRGFLLQCAFFGSLPALPLLLRVAHTRRAVFAGTVYGLSLVALFGVSTLFPSPGGGEGPPFGPDDVRRVRAAVLGVAERRVCGALMVPRSAVRDRSRRVRAPVVDEILAARLQRLITQHPTFGYRRLWALRQLAANAVGWLEAEVEAWIATRPPRREGRS